MGNYGELKRDPLILGTVRNKPKLVFIPLFKSLHFALRLGLLAKALAYFLGLRIARCPESQVTQNNRPLHPIKKPLVR